MLKEKVLIPILFFIPFNLLSQGLTDYYQGYIIKSTNDTLHGLVKLRDAFPYNVFSNVRFKAAESARKETFSPDEIKGFVMGKEVYESKYSSAEKEDKRFFKVISKGYLSLYVSERYDGPNTGSTFIILLEKQGTDEVVIYYAADYFFPFRKKIAEYLKECPILAKKITQKEYQKKHIEQIVNDFNKCIRLGEVRSD